jgi:hypothetical protein
MHRYEPIFGVVYKVHIGAYLKTSMVTNLAFEVSRIMVMKYFSKEDSPHLTTVTHSRDIGQLRLHQLYLNIEGNNRGSTIHSTEAASFLCTINLLSFHNHWNRRNTHCLSIPTDKVVLR